MTRVFEELGRLTHSGEGDLVERDTVLGRVTFEIVTERSPLHGLGPTKGTIQAVDESLHLGKLAARMPPPQLTLVFAGGTWDCAIQHFRRDSSGIETTEVMSRGKPPTIRLDP